MTETISFGNRSQGRWFHNDPQDMKIAQEAIKSRIGSQLQGVSPLDKFARKEYGKVKNNKSTYFFGFNDCKGKAVELLNNAKKAADAERRSRNENCP